MPILAEPRPIPAPGLRIELRDAEWRVLRVDATSDGGHLLTCEGLSEMVRGCEATFLTTLDPDYRILDPAQTSLVEDPTSHYRASRCRLVGPAFDIASR